MIDAPKLGQDAEEVAVDGALDQPPRDEVGVPDEQLETCPSCNQLYPADGWHCCEDNMVGDVPEEVRR
jgi:hypothetical protein